MGTFELLIVFAALMAVISLVAIAIDWVGRPLRNRRFIPRIYRYDDEMVADPALLGTPVAATPVMAAAPMAASVPVAAAPVTVATLGPRPESPEELAQVAQVPAAEPAAAMAGTTTLTAPPPTPPRRNSGDRRSSFQDAVRQPEPAHEAHGQIARTVPQAAAPNWHPGMPLDARVGERKATVAVKAERYWKAAAAHLADDHGHFDARSRELMSQGKPPRRRNPRTGETEAMELVGLRAASKRSDVRMRWPDDAVDPWSPS